MQAKAMVCALALALVGAAACSGKKDGDKGTGGSAEAPKTEPSAADGPVDVKAKVASARELMKQKKYAEAVAELELAVKAAPTDELPLSELGWAAFKAGDLARAEEANKKVIEISADAKRKGAAFYNLGRIAEERGDVEAAREAYAHSLEARPDNKTVQRHLDRLSTKPELVCDLMNKRDDICKCLLEDVAEQSYSTYAREGENSSCEPVGKPVNKVSLWRAALQDGESGHYLVRDEGKGELRVMGVLSREYSTGRSDEGFELKSMTVKKAGKRSFLWVEHHASYFWGHMGSTEESDSRVVTVCGAGPQEVCWLQLLQASRTVSEEEEWDDEEETMVDDGEVPAEEREDGEVEAAEAGEVAEPPAEGTAGPIKWDWELDMTLTNKPSVKAKAKAGKPPEYLLGEHDLP